MGYLNMMTNKEILDEVYNKLRKAKDGSSVADEIGLLKPIAYQRELANMIDFIEQEWQHRDALEEWRAEVFAKADDGQKYNMNDVNENSAGEGSHERFVKLKISKDGTVEGIG